MTYIEFFDKTAAENVCASLIAPPERVILVGDKGKLLNIHAERYRALFTRRGYRVEFICRTVNRNNLQSIVEALSQIVEAYENCVFDLTGGEDLYLVAVGIVSQRYSHKNIQMHRFNIGSNTVIDCDQDGVTLSEGMQPMLTVAENIQVYGGEIIGAAESPWVLDEAFLTELDAMWQLCRQDVRRWNRQLGVLENACNLGMKSPDGLQVTLQRNRSDAKFRLPDSLLKALRERGLLTDYHKSPEEITFTFKNAQVKRCLTKAGQVLEMKIYAAAKCATGQDGQPVYQDVMTGVRIDWDGRLHEEKGTFDTENEIDVLLMHGMIPVFVSCKNGHVAMEELYKLHTVATRFGGRYAKKVLVATALDRTGDYARYVRQRASDMGIRLIEDVQTMDDAELIRILRSLWRN